MRVSLQLVGLIEPFADNVCCGGALSGHIDAQHFHVVLYVRRTAVILLTAVIEGIAISLY